MCLVQKIQIVDELSPLCSLYTTWDWNHDTDCKWAFHLTQKDNFLRQIQFVKIIIIISDAFRTGKYVHYQAVSHTENQNLQLFLYLKSHVKELMELITEVHRVQQTMCQKLIQADWEEGRVSIHWCSNFHHKGAFFRFLKVLLILVTQKTKNFQKSYLLQNKWWQKALSF